MIQKFRKGDIVSVEGVVRYDSHSDVSGDKLFLDVGHNSVVVQPDTVTMVLPCFKPGDTAYVPDSGASHLEGPNPPQEIKVIAVWGRLVWATTDGLETNVYDAMDLQRELEKTEETVQ